MKEQLVHFIKTFVQFEHVTEFPWNLSTTYDTDLQELLEQVEPTDIPELNRLLKPHELWFNHIDNQYWIYR